MTRTDFIATLIAATTAAPTSTPSGSYQTKGAGYLIEVSKVVPGHDASSQSSVTIKYQFDGRSTVVLNTLGTVPGKGDYTFLTRATSLTFTKATGEQLATVSLHQTDATAGAGDQSTPDFATFGSNYALYSYQTNATFFDRLNQATMKFSLVTDSDTVTDGNKYYITSYHVIATDDPHVFSKVSLAVRVPDPLPSVRPMQYGIVYSAQEKNVGGDWHGSLSATSVKAIHDFIDNFCSVITS